MEPKEFLAIMHQVEHLKNVTRHCDTTSGRRESVAEHSWRLSLMPLLLRESFPELDMDKVTQMCLIHDLGEAFTGDKPAFEKTEADSQAEKEAYRQWLSTLPPALSGTMTALLAEMEALQTPEAKFYKALDRMEALIQHNEADIAGWLPLEYDLQKTYGWENCTHDPRLMALREEILQETLDKIENTKDASAC